jgi:hypothetical protein
MPVEKSDIPRKDDPADLTRGDAEERMRAEMQKALADDPEIQAVIQALARKKKT